MWSRVLLFAIAVGLVGCGSEPPPPPAPAKPEAPTPTVLDDQLKAIDKAKEVEAQEMERKRKMDEQLDGG
jgi:outer membrane biosynthesis protein TonB